MHQDTLATVATRAMYVRWPASLEPKQQRPVPRLHRLHRDLASAENSFDGTSGGEIHDKLIVHLALSRDGCRKSENVAVLACGKQAGKPGTGILSRE